VDTSILEFESTTHKKSGAKMPGGLFKNDAPYSQIRPLSAFEDEKMASKFLGGCNERKTNVSNHSRQSYKMLKHASSSDEV
jgi:hypothetical protein